MKKIIIFKWNGIENRESNIRCFANGLGKRKK